MAERRASMAGGWRGRAGFALAGWLSVAAAAGAVPAEVFEELAVVRSQRLGVHYEVEGIAAGDLARVELWYGEGLSGPWRLYDYDSDRESPVEFVAEREGVWRFLVVAVDRWGRRSYRGQTEGGGVLPQEVVYVDYTAPELYLYSLRGGEVEAGEVRVRWSGYDGQAGAYPVGLYYQVDGGQWEELAGDLPASGEYGWVLPERLAGAVRVKVEMRDRAGNVASEVSEELVVVRAAAEVEVTAEDAELTEEERVEVERWVRRGNLHSERGEWGQAVEAYERALEVDGRDVSAGVNLANALYRQGRYEKAQQQYERCLRLYPGRASALFGLAQSQITLGQPVRARETLETLLEREPRDWQGWLLYGNVSAELGDREAALTGWQRASDDVSPVRSLAMEQLRRFAARE